MAAFTIKAVDDPRTLNRALHLRPPGNVYSMNELVEIWEAKIGKKLERVFVSEQELLRRINGNGFVRCVSWRNLDAHLQNYMNSMKLLNDYKIHLTKVGCQILGIRLILRSIPEFCLFW